MALSTLFALLIASFAPSIHSEMPSDHPFVVCATQGGEIQTLSDGSHVCESPRSKH